MIKLLIFDHDMTLVDSSYAIMAGTNLVAEAIGKPPITHDTMLRLSALTLRDFFQEIWGGYREEWAALYLEKVAPIEYTHIRPFPEAPGVLEKLREMGLSLAVASNRRNPRAAMDKSGMSRYFDAIVGPIDGLPPKPDPGMLTHLMERFGVSREETLYIGDSDIDMETGLSAGVRAVGVTRGNFTKEQLEALGAWRVVGPLDELFPIFRELREDAAKQEQERENAGRK